MIWINLVACAAALVAAMGAWRMLARRRRLKAGVQATCLAVWQQRSPSGQGAPIRQWLVILIHTLSLIVVCVLLLSSLNRAAPGPLTTRFETPSARWLAATVGFEDPQLNSIGWVAAVLSGFVAGNTLGGLGGFGLVMLFGPAISACVAEDGVWFGVLLLPWRHVRSVRLCAAHDQILLYSYTRPESDPVTLSPPTKKVYEEVEGMLGGLLARNADVTGLPQPHGTQPQMVVLFLLGLIAAAAVAFAVYPLEAEWVWFFYGLELLALSAGGRRFLNAWAPNIFVEG